MAHHDDRRLPARAGAQGALGGDRWSDAAAIDGALSLLDRLRAEFNRLEKAQAGYDSHES